MKQVQSSLFYLCVLTLVAVLFPSTARGFEFSQTPERIMIPGVEIDLPVETAEIAYNTWEASDSGASFGQGTALPGKLGNTVIFAHALPGLFGSLENVQVGEHVHVFTKYDWFVYEVTDVLVVLPKDTAVIQQGSHTELTLYTCIGFNDSHRFVVKAKLLSNPF